MVYIYIFTYPHLDHTMGPSRKEGSKGMAVEPPAPVHNSKIKVQLVAMGLVAQKMFGAMWCYIIFLITRIDCSSG